MLTPFLHQHQPSRESRFWGKVGDWWTKRALIMLNFLLKTRQNQVVPHARSWATARREHTPTTASASGCRACCSQPTEAASWKRRSNLPSTASFQLVENAWNDFCLVAFLRNNYVLRQTNGGRISVFIMSFLYNNRKVFCQHGLVNRDFYVNLSRTSYMKRALLSAFAT